MKYVDIIKTGNVMKMRGGDTEGQRMRNIPKKKHIKK